MFRNHCSLVLSSVNSLSYLASHLIFLRIVGTSRVHNMATSKTLPWLSFFISTEFYNTSYRAIRGRINCYHADTLPFRYRIQYRWIRCPAARTNVAACFYLCRLGSVALDVRLLSVNGIVNLRMGRTPSATSPLPCARHTTMQAIYRSDGTARPPISGFSHGVLVVCLPDISGHKVSIKPAASRSTLQALCPCTWLSLRPLYSLLSLPATYCVLSCEYNHSQLIFGGDSCNHRRHPFRD